VFSLLNINFLTKKMSDVCLFYGPVIDFNIFLHGYFVLFRSECADLVKRLEKVAGLDADPSFPVEVMLAEVTSKVV